MSPRYARVRPSRGMSAVGAAFGVVVLAIAGGAGAPPIFLLVVLVVIAINLFNAIGRGFASEVIEFGDGRAPLGGSTGAFCPGCGTPVNLGAKFCTRCGHRLDA